MKGGESVREYIKNVWTGTHHVDPDCKGLRASKAPHVPVHLSAAELFGVKLCGFCGRVSEEAMLSRSA